MLPWVVGAGLGTRVMYGGRYMRMGSAFLCCFDVFVTLFQGEGTTFPKSSRRAVFDVGLLARCQ